ncbi:hypothetical protein [Curtobacterium sp. Leaf261]|uniref:hypothetical protein n=1 Tax=Curtobacterium sp. Leaf261 TaxID=1736311 RepID=UPI0012E287A8|nr:hypothetical protein [Curtobacterium sp. Leaf261]
MSDRSPTKSRWFTATATAAAAASALLLVSGCAQIRQQTGDAWSVTYEVSVDTQAGAALTEVATEGAEKRGEAPKVRDVGSVTTTAPEDGSATSTWTRESIVLAKDRAMVRATPPAGATATCRILLDGKKVIAERHADPGAQVKCRVRTPAFDG